MEAEKTVKPCPVCGNVFLGNKYGGTYETCPACTSKVKISKEKKE